MSKKQRPPLYAHQEETVDFLIKNQGGAVLSEQGTGKTRSVIEFVNRKFPNRDYRVLIVCPATLINVWKEEITKFADFNNHWVLRGSSLEKRLRPVEDFKPGWYIVNYEGLRAIRNRSNLLAGGCDWSVVIADEMTRIKNPNAKQSKAVHDFSRPKGKFNPIRIGITGTPITQSPLDVFSQFKFVEPNLFGDKFYSFRSRYAVMSKRFMGGRSFNEITGYQRLEEITEKIFSVSIRHTKEQCLDLPDKIYKTIKVDWKPENRKLYNSMTKELIAEIKGQTTIAVPNALSKLMKLRQIAGGFVITPEGEEIDTDSEPEKMKVLLDLIEDTPGKIIVWAYFKRDLRRISESLSKASIPFSRVSGMDSTEERSEAVSRLQGGDIKVCLAQCGVAQYGLTMTAAETAIFYSQGFSAEERMQAEDRNHRIGTKRPVSYIDLVMRDSVDESIATVLLGRKKLAQKMTQADLKNIAFGTPLE